MASKKIPYETRQKIKDQVLKEIMFCRNFKQGKTRWWRVNEDLYYQRKIDTEKARANVDLGLMQSHVHTIMSKIDNPLMFKFTKRKESQLLRVLRLNSLRTFDQDRDDWDMKDLVGKKQSIIYGRSIYSYFAESPGGIYTPHLDPVDVYDFLIDPSANGIDIETANFLGDYGVTVTRQALEKGMKSGMYLKEETTELIAGSSNATEWNQEQTNKINRTRDQNVWLVNKEMSDTDKFKFWRWGTTFEGQRYYVLISSAGGQAIRVEPIEELFPSGLWWYWTYAAFPDLTEFWTPSFCDYVREIFMAQATSINQMLDNSEQINKPMKKVMVGAIENMAELKYRRDGLIKVKKDIDIDKAYQTVTTPAIDAPIKVYELLDGIQEKSSGVTAGAQGAADNDSGQTATIYEGNEANSADRFGLFNKSYAHGYKRFSRLYENGVRENLSKKVSVDILGPDGIDEVMIGRKDIFWKDDNFNVMVQSSTAELDLSTQDKEVKVKFLSGQDALPNSPQNNQKSYEMQASIVGFNEEEIRELLDRSDFGDAELMSMAARDIEMILDGEDLPPNPAATTAYKQRFVDYMQRNQYSIGQPLFDKLTAYVKSLDSVIMANMVKMANATLMKQKMAAIASGTPAPAAGGSPAGGNAKPGMPVPQLAPVVLPTPALSANPATATGNQTPAIQ